MRRESARSLLKRHSSAGVMRRLDEETSKLIDRWFGRPIKAHASQRQLRDELAFGSRAFQRVERERGEARKRSRNDERGLRERSEREKGVHVPGVFGGEQRAEGLHQVEKSVTAAEHRAEARVQDFFTRKAEALQRLYRKEQLALKYQAEYLGREAAPARARREQPEHRRKRHERREQSRRTSEEGDAEYHARQRREMERAIARDAEEQRAQRQGEEGEGHAQQEGVAERRRVRMHVPASAHHWSTSTERDIERVAEARAKPEWYGYSSPITGVGARELASNPIVTTALARTRSAEGSRGRSPQQQLTWPLAPRRHPQGAYKDATVYDQDYSWPSTSEVVEGDEWQRKGDCGMFGANC